MSYPVFRNDFLAEVESRLADVDVSAASVNELLVNGALYKMAAAVGDADLLGPSSLRFLETLSSASLQTWLADASNMAAYLAMLDTPTVFEAILASTTLLTNIMSSATAKLLFKQSNSDRATSIPTMTSATAPAGVASHSSTNGAGGNGWNALDKSSGTGWKSAAYNITSQWVKYEFPTPVHIHTATFLTPNTNESPQSVRIEYSVDNTTWQPGPTLTLTQNALSTFDVAVANRYKYWRVFILSNYGNTNYITLNEMDLFGFTGG